MYLIFRSIVRIDAEGRPGVIRPRELVGGYPTSEEADVAIRQETEHFSLKGDLPAGGGRWAQDSDDGPRWLFWRETAPAGGI